MTQLSEATIRQQLADCHRMMVMADLIDYSGHVSARIPGTKRILILPRDASRAAVTADEMLVVGLDGTVLEGGKPAPTETAIHLGVYRHREDVQAVGHGHHGDGQLVAALGPGVHHERLEDALLGDPEGLGGLLPVALHVVLVIAALAFHGRICTGAECFPKVTLHHFRHQSICRASHCDNLLQEGGAIGPGFDRAFQSVRLALDTPQACDGSLFVL